MIDLGDEATAAFLHSGCALVLCTATVDGRPQAARGWGLTVVDPTTGLLRLLVEADDHITVANIRGRGPIAVTATSVGSFRSVQLKGYGRRIEPATAEDDAKRDQYTADFLRDVHVANDYPLDVLVQWAARPITAALIEVDSAYDQTPGPTAGHTIDGGRA